MEGGPANETGFLVSSRYVGGADTRHGYVDACFNIRHSNAATDARRGRTPHVRAPNATMWILPSGNKATMLR